MRVVLLSLLIVSALQPRASAGSCATQDDCAQLARAAIDAFTAAKAQAPAGQTNEGMQSAYADFNTAITFLKQDRHDDMAVTAANNLASFADSVGMKNDFIPTPTAPVDSTAASCDKNGTGCPGQTTQKASGMGDDVVGMKKGGAGDGTEPETTGTVTGPSPTELEQKAKADGNPQEFTSAADGYAKMNQPQMAINDYNEALKRDPKNKAALNGLVEAKIAEGDREGAVGDAKKLLGLDPQNQLAQLIVGHGDSIAQGGSQMKLKTDFGAGRGPDADLASGVDGRLAVGSAAGAVPRAQGVISGQAPPAAASASAGPGGPFSVMILYGQAEQRLRMNDLNGAFFAARQAVDQDPKNAKAWSLLAKISAQMGNYKGALAAAAEALKLDPQDAQALRAKSYAEFQLGDFSAAYQDALRATQVDPQSGLGFLYLAMAEEKLGNTADALKHYEQAIALDATLGAVADEALRRLRGASPTGLTNTAKRHLVRGGAVAISLLLILLGLLGTAAGRRFTTGAGRLIGGGSENARELAPAPSVRPGMLLGGFFRVRGELGRGGMGVVYDAIDEALQRRVAIKQLQRGEGATTDDLERLLKEARLVAKLSHPHIAQIFTVLTEGDLFLVFEFVDGQSLEKLLCANGKLPTGQVRRLLSEVAAALDYAHSQKIVHRDLKPSNIMIAGDGSAKVMDFGIAHQSRGGAETTLTAASGTPQYMAPEQALGSVSKASDFYALGVLAYEMLTGARPFEGPDYLGQKLRKEFVPPTRRDAGFQSGLDIFFSAALDPDPTKRPPDMQAFLRAFDDACSAAGKSV